MWNWGTDDTAPDYWTTYTLTEEVALTGGAVYSARLTQMSSSQGGFLGHNVDVYDGGHYYADGYGGVYGDLPFKTMMRLIDAPCHPGESESCGGDPSLCAYAPSGEVWTYGGIWCTAETTSIFETPCVYPTCQ